MSVYIYIDTHTFRYRVKPSNGNVFLQRTSPYCPVSSESYSSKIYNANLFAKLSCIKCGNKKAITV